MREDKRHMTMNTNAVFCNSRGDILCGMGTSCRCGCDQSNKRRPSCYRANLAALGVRVVGEVLQCLVP